jgi:hypothetical protein
VRRWYRDDPKTLFQPEITQDTHAQVAQKPHAIFGKPVRIDRETEEKEAEAGLACQRIREFSKGPDAHHA